MGCTQEWADNYDSFATVDDMSCFYMAVQIHGPLILILMQLLKTIPVTMKGVMIHVHLVHMGGAALAY